MSKEEIEILLEECGRWESNNQVFHFDAEEAAEKLSQLIENKSRERAIAFNTWANIEWQFYASSTGENDGIWLSRRVYENVPREIKTTDQLYNLFIQQTENKNE